MLVILVTHRRRRGPGRSLWVRSQLGVSAQLAGPGAGSGSSGGWGGVCPLVRGRPQAPRRRTGQYPSALGTSSPVPVACRPCGQCLPIHPAW